MSNIKEIREYCGLLYANGNPTMSREKVHTFFPNLAEEQSHLLFDFCKFVVESNFLSEFTKTHLSTPSILMVDLAAQLGIVTNTAKSRFRRDMNKLDDALGGLLEVCTSERYSKTELASVSKKLTILANKYSSINKLETLLVADISSYKPKPNRITDEQFDDVSRYVYKLSKKYMGMLVDNGESEKLEYVNYLFVTDDGLLNEVDKVRKQELVKKLI